MDGWTDSGHAVPLLPGTSNSPRGRSSPFPNRLEGCAQREGPLWPLVWGPPRPRWAQGQLRLLSSAAGQKLVGSLPLRVPSPPGPRCAAWGLGHVGSPGCPWGGFPGEVLACASMVVCVPEGALLFCTVASAHVLRPVSPLPHLPSRPGQESTPPAAVC